MKKKVFIGIVIGLVLLFPILKNTLNEIMAPDKVLVLYNQVDKDTFQFAREIKGKEKITNFENLFDDITFVKSDFKEESYPDMVVRINHKSGIYTHSFKIWFTGEEGIALYTTEDKMVGKLSNAEVTALQEIFN